MLHPSRLPHAPPLARPRFQPQHRELQPKRGILRDRATRAAHHRIHRPPQNNFRAPPVHMPHVPRLQPSPSQRINNGVPRPADATLRFPNGVLRWSPCRNRLQPLPHAAPPNPRAAEDLRIHRHLRGSRLRWDIRAPPSGAKYRTGIPDYHASATYSGARRIAIELDDPRMALWTKSWGSLTVCARNDGPVTIQDVLDAVYNYFSSDLTWQDFFGMTADGQARMRASHWQRMIQDPNTPEKYLRGDVLHGCTRFVSLSVLSFRGSHLTLALQLDSSRA